MPQLQEIVQVDITRETSRITQVGFGRALLAVSGFEDETSEKVKAYGSLAEVLADGFATDSAAYTGAAAYFGQQRRPASLLIGEYDSAAPVASLNAIDAVNPDWYCLIVADEDGEVGGESREDRLVDVAAWIETQERICILSAFRADTVDETVGDDTVSITARLHSAGYKRTTTIWDGFSPDNATDEGENLVANGDFSDGDDGWFASQGSELDGQFYFESEIDTSSPMSVNRPFSIPPGNYRYVMDIESVSGSDLTYIANIGADPTTAISEGFQTLTAGVTTVDFTHIEPDPDGSLAINFYGTVGSTVVLNSLSIVSISDAVIGSISGPAAWAGRMLPTDPGTQTWAHKRLIGVPSAVLSTAQRTNLFAKNGNLLSTIAGLPNTRYGTMASGEYIDIIRGIDWLVQRMREDVFRAFANTGKISFTGAGIAAIENIIRARLRTAQDIGLLAEYTVTAPGIADTQTADRAERLATGFEFSARTANAIHTLGITGRVAP